MWYIAIDGDDVGNLLRDYIVTNDVEGCTQFSMAVDQYFLSLQEKLRNDGFDVIFRAGDSLLARTTAQIPVGLFDSIPEGPCRISIGIGLSVEYAYLALQLAKARGKHQVVILEYTSALTVHTWS